MMRSRDIDPDVRRWGLHLLDDCTFSHGRNPCVETRYDPDLSQVGYVREGFCQGSYIEHDEAVARAYQEELSQLHSMEASGMSNFEIEHARASVIAQDWHSSSNRSDNFGYRSCNRKGRKDCCPSRKENDPHRVGVFGSSFRSGEIASIRDDMRPSFSNRSYNLGNGSRDWRGRKDCCPSRRENDPHKVGVFGSSFRLGKIDAIRDDMRHSSSNRSYNFDCCPSRREHDAQEVGVFGSSLRSGEIASISDDMWHLDISDESSLDGEVGKRFNQMNPIPHVPKTNEKIPSYDEEISDHQRMLDRLQLYELVESKVEGDGNCQFRALSDQLYRSPNLHKFVREQIVQQLKSRSDLYAGYVPMAYSEYLKKMSKSGEWGDHVTLQAAADWYGVKIFVITSFKDTCYIEILPHIQKSGRVIFLSFWAEVHYNSIYPEGGDFYLTLFCYIIFRNAFILYKEKEEMVEFRRLGSAHKRMQLFDASDADNLTIFFWLSKPVV